MRDRFRAATREAILEAAAGLLTTDGAAHIRMEDIAGRAGIAVGTLYNYFEDRPALVRALFDTRSQVLFDALDARKPRSFRSSDTPTAFAAELTAFVAPVIEHFNTSRFLLHIMLEEQRHRGVDPHGVSRRRTLLGELFTRAERLASQGIRVHALRKGSPRTYAALLVGMIRGVLSAALERGDELPPDAATDIVRVFMTGAGR